MTDNVPEDLLSPLGLKRAMKAFKKRLKLMRLDDESSLGGGPFTCEKKLKCEYLKGQR